MPKVSLSAYLMGAGVLVFVFDMVLYLPQSVPLRIDPQTMYYTLLAFSTALFLAGAVEFRLSEISKAIKNARKEEQPASSTPQVPPAQSPSTVSDETLLKMFLERQDDVVTQNGSRNNYYLVVIGILALGFTQSPQGGVLSQTAIRIVLSVFGIAISLAWLLMQHRSSQYVLYYKQQSNVLSGKTNTPEFFPKSIGGVEMRKTNYVLPIVFLFFWVALLLAETLMVG